MKGPGIAIILGKKKGDGAEDDGGDDMRQKCMDVAGEMFDALKSDDKEAFQSAVADLMEMYG